MKTAPTKPTVRNGPVQPNRLDGSASYGGLNKGENRERNMPDTGFDVRSVRHSLPNRAGNCPALLRTSRSRMAGPLNVQGPGGRSMEAGRAVNASEARKVAGEWHAGQSSALYAFCSTGTILPGINGEIRQALAEVKAHVGHYTGQDIREIRALDAYVGERWTHAAEDATLGVGHVWTATACPAYRTLDPGDCSCL